MDREKKKLDGKSFDIIEDNIKKLQELFPEIVTEGKVDIDKLALLFDKARNEDTEGKLDGEERYEFTWKGKKEAMRIAQKQSTGTLRPCREESVNFDDTENLYIEGDNLEVLRALQSSYRGKVKMIYIDPPYNTGNDFVYKDDFKDNIANYKEKMNEAYKTNTNNNGRYHTNWLNMMYPRLKLARNLLTDDGVIFISIDDNEVANLKKICDEIFGEENFRGLISRATGTPTGQGTSRLINELDYILVYSKTKEAYFNGLAFSSEDEKIYNQRDENGKYLIRPLRKTGGEDRREDRPSMYYAVKNPEGKDTFPISPSGYESRWRCSQDRYKELIKDNMIEWKKSEENGIDVWKPYQKFYMEGRKKQPSNLWNKIDGNKKATREVKILFGKSVFDFPKPVALLRQCVKIASNEDSIILDFFSGAATMTNAIFEENLIDNGKRRFIVVQIPEETDEKSEAFKSGYKNICEIGKERIRRAGKKILEENKDKEGIEDLDIGFKVFKLDSTNLKEWDENILSNKEDRQQSFDDLKNPIKDGRTTEDLVYEIMLKYGVDLTMPIEELEILGSKVYSVGCGYLMICLEDNISLDLIEAIGNEKPNRVVLADKGLTTSDLINGEKILTELGVQDIRTI